MYFYTIGELCAFLGSAWYGFIIKSIAFCCISTGEFHYPRKEAAQIALNTVSSWLASSGNDTKVIFNVFKDEDLEVYRSLLKF